MMQQQKQRNHTTQRHHSANYSFTPNMNLGNGRRAEVERTLSVVEISEGGINLLL